MDFAAALGPYVSTGMCLVCGSVFVVVGVIDMVGGAMDRAEGMSTTLGWGIGEVVGGMLLILNSFSFFMLDLNNLNLSGIWFSIAVCLMMIVLSLIRFFKARQRTPSLIITFFAVVALNTLRRFLEVMSYYLP